MSVSTAADGIKDVRTPLTDADVVSLKAGDRVRISGVIYTARDAAHGRLAPIYAISAAAEGLIDPEHEAMVWCHLNRGNYMQTPLVYGEELYLLSDAGILACLDLATGEQRYRERLGDGATGFTASMVAGDGKLYATSEEGTVHVVAAGTSFELRAKNQLGETCMASPAISDGVLFWRTRGHLVAVGE